MTARDDLYRELKAARPGLAVADLLGDYRAEVLAEAAQVALSDRCPRCLCADCGGRFDQHSADGCHCQDCAAWPETACTAFELEEGIGWVAEQLSVLLSSHLDEAHARRTLAVAHAAHHALRDYDQAREQLRANTTASQEN